MLKSLITLKAGETYEVAQGLEVIKEAVRKAHSVQICDPPPSLLNELAPYLTTKRTNIYLPSRTKVSDQLRPQVVRTKNRLKAAYHGQTMVLGSINLPRIIFDITWQQDEIYDISAVTVSRCLSCPHRLNLRSQASQDNLFLGSILPLSQAVVEIERHLRQADWAFFTNIPPELVSQFVTALHDKDIKLVLPYGAQIPQQLKPVERYTRTFPRLVKTSSRIYGREVYCGGICLPQIHFAIGWDEDEIIEVRSFELLECVKCMHDAHKLGWHFCKRIW